MRDPLPEGRVDDSHATASRLTISAPPFASGQFAAGIECGDGSGGSGSVIFSRSVVGHAGSWEDGGRQGRSNSGRDLTTICNDAASTPGGGSLSRNRSRDVGQSDESVEARFRYSATRPGGGKQVGGAAEDHRCASLVLVHGKYGGH